jgi:hypothetical protein
VVHGLAAKGGLVGPGRKDSFTLEGLEVRIRPVGGLVENHKPAVNGVF